MDQTLCNWLRHIMHGQQQRPRSQQSEHAGSKGSRSSASEGFGAAPSTRVGQSRNSPGPQTYWCLVRGYPRSVLLSRSILRILFYLCSGRG